MGGQAWGPGSKGIVGPHNGNGRDLMGESGGGGGEGPRKGQPGLLGEQVGPGES